MLQTFKQANYRDLKSAVKDYVSENFEEYFEVIDVLDFMSTNELYFDEENKRLIYLPNERRRVKDITGRNFQTEVSTYELVKIFGRFLTEDVVNELEDFGKAHLRTLTITTL
jgi:hypothetical protein